MSLLQVILLAVVQGLTEFLPISSTAHLILVPWLAGWEDQGLTFDVALHAGTLVAVLAYFAREWRVMFKDLVRKVTGARQPATNEKPGENLVHPLPGTPEMRLALLGILVVATIPGALAGYVLEGYAETVFRSPVLVAGQMLLITVVMWLADRRQTLDRRLESIGLRDGLWIGLAQAVAVVPGTSRSGITISVGLFRNLTRESAARFSFLLSTPIIGGAALLKGMEIWKEGWPAGASASHFIVGFVVSAVVGYAAIAFLLRYLQMRTLKIFVAYRLALGVIILAVEFLHSST
jgi:undecaprenyl-diphosphatase